MPYREHLQSRAGFYFQRVMLPVDHVSADQGPFKLLTKMILWVNERSLSPRLDKPADRFEQIQCRTHKWNSFLRADLSQIIKSS
jgi:hypothetical protein